MNRIGLYNKNANIEVYNIENRNITLYGWNGEKYTDCFEVANKVGEYFIEIVKENIVVKPIYSNDFENIIDYEILEG